MTRENSQLQSNLEELRNEREDEFEYHREEIYHLKKKNEDLEERRKTLKRRNKKLQTKIENLQTRPGTEFFGTEPGGKIVEKLHNEIECLENQLNKSRAINRFMTPAKDGDIDGDVLQKRNLVQALVDFGTIKQTIHKVLRGYEGLRVVREAQAIKNPTLASLLQRISGHSTNGCEDQVGIPVELERTGLRSLVQSLISAAMCAWVIEADIGALFQSDSHEYNSLRKLLACQGQFIPSSKSQANIVADGDGEQTAAFEYAAHQFNIEDDHINDFVIPKRAQFLARRVLKCILPFIEEHRKLGEQYVVSDADWSEVNVHVVEIFKLALLVKIRLLLSTDLYNCTFDLPGTTFEDDSMEMAPEADLSSLTSGMSGLVSVTILPSLTRCIAGRRRFSYNRFVVAKRFPKGHLKECLTKAVVQV